MKILIIEDDAAIAEVERDFLEINGFEVSIESNGIKGMEQALNGGFNLSACKPINRIFPVKRYY